jgi:hypothetical protein
MVSARCWSLIISTTLGRLLADPMVLPFGAAGAAHASFGDHHAMIVLKKPGNALGSEVSGMSQMKDFFPISGTVGQDGFRGPGLRLIRPFSPSLWYCFLQQ